MKRVGIQPLEQKKVSDRVVEAIQNYIADNNLAKGERLPSERELTIALEVGSRSVREALKKLEARGVLRIEQGRGAFVEERYRDDFIGYLADSLDFALTRGDDLLLELAYVRNLIEAGVVADVAEHSDAKTNAGLQALLAAMDSAQAEENVEEYNRLDVLLHKAIIRATGNRILVALYDRLTSLLSHSVKTTGDARERVDRSMQEHRLIVDSIREKDPVRARQIMRQHLEHTIRTLNRYVAERRTE